MNQTIAFALKCLKEKDVSGVKIIIAKECSDPVHGEIPLCFLKRNVSHGTYVESGCLNSDSIHRGFCYFHYLNRQSINLRECLPLVQEDQEICICNKDLCNAREEWGYEGFLNGTKTFSKASKLHPMSSFRTFLLTSFFLLYNP
ncbi:uncharacterized protein [Lepeophtheirus salmonis]|uniref:uncharacterized protein n=1 Tax=Lepeophtheirus salmonis TaxID=72036 RepID=UPI001AE17AB0|nr:uncharacterized protein LOC121125978 [Lepeophtheirus salmonis]